MPPTATWDLSDYYRYIVYTYISACTCVCVCVHVVQYNVCVYRICTVWYVDTYVSVYVFKIQLYAFFKLWLHLESPALAGLQAGPRCNAPKNWPHTKSLSSVNLSPHHVLSFFTSTHTQPLVITSRKSQAQHPRLFASVCHVRIWLVSNFPA